jgi:Quinohemoprotein amine dehydrogenase, alpha subunit domain III
MRELEVLDDGHLKLDFADCQEFFEEDLTDMVRSATKRLIEQALLADQGDGVWAPYPCESATYDVSSTFYNTWVSDSTPIVTVDAYGTHTGVSVGSTDSYCAALLTSNDAHEMCPALYRNPQGGANVTPTITSISPTRGLIGATTSSVTITGKGLSGGHIDTPAAIQVSNITVSTDTKIVFDAIVSGTATPGNNVGAIYVTASGRDSNKEDFYVQVPTTLSMVAGSASGTTEQLCTSSACGTIVSFKYQVYDQDTAPQPIMASMSMWDSFGSFDPDPLGMNGAPASTTCTFD